MKRSNSSQPMMDLTWGGPGMMEQQPPEAPAEVAASGLRESPVSLPSLSLSSSCAHKTTEWQNGRMTE